MRRIASAVALAILAQPIGPALAQLPPKGMPAPPPTVPRGAPPVRVGGSDDGIRPAPKPSTPAKSGTNDDGIRAAGINDERTLKVATLDPGVRRARFGTRLDKLKTANDRLLPAVRPHLEKVVVDRAAVDKLLASCVKERVLAKRTACVASLEKATRGPARRVVELAALDPRLEVGKLRSDLGFTAKGRIPRPDAPEEPPAEPPPADTPVYEFVAGLISAEVIPLSDPVRQEQHGGFSFLDREGDEVDFNTNGQLGAHCGVNTIGACYKRGGIGSRFDLGRTMRRATARVDFSVMASAFAFAWGGYSSSEAKVSIVVRRTGVGEVCRDERSLAQVVAPVIGIGQTLPSRSTMSLACTFDHDGSSPGYQVMAVLEVWAGTGGLPGSGASALVALDLDRASVEASARP
jgi:hypothetical protein